MIEDTGLFEMSLNVMLQNRASIGGAYKADDDQAQKPFGVSIAFLGLLFAVLASGCQSSDLPGKERELTSQVYGKISVDGNRSCANLASVLFVSMSSDDQLLVATNYRSHSDVACNRECAVL